MVSLAFSVPLFYVAMGPMFGWPEVPGLDGMENMMAAALTQLLLCVPILLVNRHYFVTGFKTLWHRAPNMDTLIALGSAASFAYSVVSLYRMAWAFGAMDMTARTRGHARHLPGLGGHDLGPHRPGQVLRGPRQGQDLRRHSRAHGPGAQDGHRGARRRRGECAHRGRSRR